MNAERVTDALKAFGFGASSIPPALFVTPDKVFRMGNPPLRIKLLTDISGVEFSACWPVREIAVVDEVTINIINLDNL